MTEIIPGIHQLQVTFPSEELRYTNIYLVQGDEECLLIDAGWNSEEAPQSLKKQLDEIGIDFKDISQIIVTHVHPDHYGLADKLRQLSRAKITLHYLEKDLINARHLNAGEFQQQAEQWLHSNGVPANELSSLRTGPAGGQQSTAPTLPDITLNGGETISAGIFNFQVLWTPGHSPGHICLYEPNKKILFPGDHILPVITPNVSLQPHSGINPLGDFFNSLNTVKKLDVNIVLPAHEYIFTDLPKRIEGIIQHHKQRSSDILETIKAEPKTAYQISTEIAWRIDFGGISFQDLAPWDRRMAVGEALAHLEWMRINERVSKSSRDSLIYYQHKI